MYTQDHLQNCLQLPVRVALERLNIDTETGDFVDEPPGVACGREYELAEDTTLTLFVARDDAEFTTFSADREWDLQAFARATVIGIQLESPKGTKELGEIPSVFRSAGDPGE